ncbi:MAG TPA: NAD-dependent epimerase/dehydratase family protein [Parachlamydiaceae bacterium]|nr:NAD-dependent epimerase/dehydratase family protein [Parachlamydiaceae bacterium]
MILGKAVVLKILILGGTHFLGLHLTEELQKNGHEVTLFNRGIQNPNIFPDIEQLHGDRDGNLEALRDRHWDAVIDTSGHVPRVVEQSAKLLAESTNHYTFISTIGVYKDFHKFGIDETYPLAELKDIQDEVITEKNEGALKGLCEAVIHRYFPKNSLIIRPGLIVGPHDPTNRFTYWPIRISEGGEVLAPARQIVQFIDVRDLAKWIVQMVEQQAIGIYNATGTPISFNNLLNECHRVTHSTSHINWVNDDFLIKEEVQDWSELPLWLSKERQMPGFMHINSQKAINTGLSFRPLTETILSTLQWNATRGPVQLKAGLDRVKENNLLMAWKKCSSFDNQCCQMLKGF